MKIKITEHDNSTVVSIHGRVDTMTAGDFESGLIEVLDGSVSKLILDCSELDYISSSGLRVFLVAQKKMMAVGGKLKLCCLKPEIKEIFDISGFSSIFAIFPDLGATSAD